MFISFEEEDILVSTFQLVPISGDQRCFDPGSEHALLGLSPWNGRYKPSYIADLVSWACERFRRVDALLPGYEAAYTLIATGTPVRDAVRLTRRAVKQLRNPALRAMREAGVHDAEEHVHTWTQLRSRPAYATSLQRVYHAYAHDPVVRDACEATTRAVIEHTGQPASQDQIDRGVDYAIREMPLLLNSPEIFDVGTSTFCYHREMTLAEPLIDEYTDIYPHEGQNFATVIQEADHAIG